MNGFNFLVRNLCGSTKCEPSLFCRLIESGAHSSHSTTDPPMKTTLLQSSRSCLLALTALAVGALPLASFADDHGGSSSTATLVTLPAVLNGEIEISGDTDWFKFTLTTPSLVTATSSGTTDVMGQLLLGGARGLVTPIYEDNSGAVAPNFMLTQLLPAGTHYVCVRAATQGGLGAYTMDFQVAPPPATQPDIALGVGGVNLAAGSLLDFGTVNLGTQTPKDIVIANVGDAGLRIYALRPSTTSALPTGATYPWRTLASYSQNIAAGNQTLLRLAFQPTVAGTYNTKYVLVSNDGDEILYEFNVRGVASGTVAEPEIAVRDGPTELVSDDTVTFGATMAGTGITKDIIIANTGLGELKITAVTFTSMTANGISNSPIGFTTVGANIFPNTVPGGGQATVTLRLGSVTPGDYNAKITMTNNDANENPMVINLTGTITPDLTRGEIDVTLAGANVPNNTTIPFGNTFTATPVSKDFVITNSGTATMPITWSMHIPSTIISDVFISSTTVIGSPLVTVADAAQVVVGMSIPGVFPPGAKVTPSPCPQQPSWP
jgi:hypothetical protein